MTLTEARIYTEVTPNAVLPYVVIGEDQVIPDTSGCAGDYEITSTVQWWSRTAGALDKGAQARAMGSAIFDALNVQLTLTGFKIDDWECQSESYSTDPDQSTHGRILMRYLATEIVA